MKPNEGCVVVFEGPDGVGKTALHGFATEYLRTRGRAVESLAFPGNEQGTLGAWVYSVHHGNPKSDVQGVGPESLQVLHVAAHIDALQRRILPAVRDGATVLLDRSWWSTWAYGVVYGVSVPFLDALVDLELRVWDPFRPALTVLVRRRESLKTEGDDQVRHLTLSDAYDKFAASADHPVVDLENEGELGEAEERVRAILSHALDLTGT